MLHGRSRARAAESFHVIAMMCVFSSAIAFASGPRWVTGPPYFSTSSVPVAWYTNSPVYYTDPGDLSASVNHAAADALVAAAAGVWNVPTSSMVIAQGGQLAEHASSANVYLGANGPVFPADVSSANYAAIQIAVIYDSDGSITDLLLGQGASDPLSCRQNGVTESVDVITRSGTIQHALVILNGHCTGPYPEQQFQLQWQLMRAFGRVLGLGWSQTNDNVFTRTPAPTAEDVSKWPIMHPIDIVCGDYTYQCQPNPFTLRDDDVASISLLYPIAKGTAVVGKVDTLSNASAITGTMNFGDGQGMQGMNILVRRKDPVTPYLEASPIISAVSGYRYRRNNGNPVTGPVANTIAASMGNVNSRVEGAFNLGYIPLLPGARLQDAYITSEAINPLYTGQYGIGPYDTSPVTPSGPPFPWQDNGIFAYAKNNYAWSVPGSAQDCVASEPGTRSSPVPVAETGWWTNVLCGYGVSAWSMFTAKANRSVTVEVTALDEQGLVAESKLLPLIGVWDQAGSTSTLPTVAAAVSPFNSIAAGLTSASFDATGTGPLKLVITDQRGDGRPDFNFRARVLYADAITPTTLVAGGGLMLLTGMGFRRGNQVLVGGAAAEVLAVTSTTILAIAPPFAALPADSVLTVDVEVDDLMTGGSTTIYSGLTYPATAVPPQGARVSVLTPVFYIAAGQSVSVTPRVALSVAGAATEGVATSWSAVSDSLVFADGGQSITDGNGLASISTTTKPLVGGAATLGSACASFGGQANLCGSFATVGVDPSKWTLTALAGPGQSVPSIGILQPVTFQVTDGSGNPVIGAPVTIYQTVTGYQVCPAEGACPIAPVYAASQNLTVSDQHGLVVVTPQQMASSAEVTTIAASTGTQAFVSIALQKLP